MKTIKVLMLVMLALPGFVYSQDYLTDEQEYEIKMSDRYYWEEGIDFDKDNAYVNALNALTERVISNIVYQTKEKDEVLKALEMNARFGQIRQEGMACVLAWIAKDSVFVTVQRPLNTEKKPVVDNTLNPEKTQVTSTESPDVSKNVVTDPVLQELVNCGNYKELKKAVMRRGIVSGELNTSDGFANPGNCLIAVFDSSGNLIALLDKGGNTRVDLKSGQSIQNAEATYRNNGYNLWYLQRK